MVRREAALLAVLPAVHPAALLVGGAQGHRQAGLLEEAREVHRVVLVAALATHPVALAALALACRVHPCLAVVAKTLRPVVTVAAHQVDNLRERATVQTPARRVATPALVMLRAAT